MSLETNQQLVRRLWCLFLDDIVIIRGNSMGVQKMFSSSNYTATDLMENWSDEDEFVA